MGLDQRLFFTFFSNQWKRQNSKSRRAKRFQLPEGEHVWFMSRERLAKGIIAKA